MKTRIISSFLMLPFLVFLYFGGTALVVLGAVLSLIGINEFYKGMETYGAKPAFIIGRVSGVLLYVLHLLMIWLDKPFWLGLLIWFPMLIMSSMVYGFNVEERKPIDMLTTLFGPIYVAFMFYFIILIDCSHISNALWLVLLVAFGTDIFAYFVGITMGKHKLCPHLSPKKSVEGAIGGIFGSILLSVLFMIYVLKEPWYLGLLIGLAGSVVAQLGDLSASAFKRQMGIKDYGKLIPGHGGILDRFDSVLFVAPVIYCLIVLFE